jgi:hypothetical protein
VQAPDLVPASGVREWRDGEWQTRQAAEVAV